MTSGLWSKKFLSCFSALLVLLFVVESRAQTRDKRDEWGGFRARYGASIRQGSFVDVTRLDYSGVTPNDLEFRVWAFPIKWVGPFVNLQHEGFSLVNQSTKQKVGGFYASLWRVSVGATGAFRLGPLRLEPQVGYAFQQLPDLGTAGAPKFAPVSRHALLLGARAQVDVWRFTFELRGELPISLAAVRGANKAQSLGFTVALGARFHLFNAGPLSMGLMLDGQLFKDDYSYSNGTRATQRMWRVGGGIDIQWKTQFVEDKRLVGTVVVVVTDSETHEPVGGVAVKLTSQDGEAQLLSDTKGNGRFRSVPVGATALRAELDGYQTFTSTVDVVNGQATQTEVVLKKEKPKFGSLMVIVSEKATQEPLAGATVTVGSAKEKTNENGKVEFKNLPAGATAFKVDMADHRPQEEAAVIVLGKVVEVAVGLSRTKEMNAATLSGDVRNTAGAPIAAELEVKELRLKVQANSKGAFTIRLPGGNYTITVSAKGYKAQTKKTSVKNGDQTIFNMTLQPR